MKKTTIAIIGAGHMGMSLLGGLIKNGYPAEKIFLAEPTIKKLNQAKTAFNINITTNNTDAIKTADTVIFAVKPDVMATTTTELANVIQQRKPLLISVAAGVREASIQQCVGGNIPIVRAMPNTPALIGCGATALFANKFTSPEQHQLAESILRSVGIVVWLETEKLMDVVTALSGSGPAYFYLLIEAMQTAAEQLGLPRDIARQLTLQTAYGAGRLAVESDKEAAELRQQAMTPGGTTEQAIGVLEKNQLRKIIAEALNAAATRATELGTASS